MLSLCNDAHISAFDKNQHIFRRGDMAQSFYVVLGGWVKIYRDTQDGDEAILGLLTRADIFGEAAIFCGETYQVSAEAVENTKLIAIPAASLRQQAISNPDIIVRVTQSLMQQVTKLQLENEHLSLMSAAQRVGCLLLQLCNDRKGETHKIEFPYEKSLAATRLGMKAETFSRALNQLREIGVSVNRDTIEISDLPKLVTFVCTDCSAGNADCAFSSIHNCSAEERANCPRNCLVQS